MTLSKKNKIVGALICATFSRWRLFRARNISMIDHFPHTQKVRPSVTLEALSFALFFFIKVKWT